MENNYNEQFEEGKMFMDGDDEKTPPKEKPKANAEATTDNEGEAIRDGDDDED